MREKICEVMRETGPSMLLSNPIMALQHMIDGMRSEPVIPERKGQSKGTDESEDKK
jgi:hypothetical protein